MPSQQLQKNTTKNSKNDKYSSNKSQQHQQQNKKKINWRKKDKNLKERGAIKLRMFKKILMLNIVLPHIIRRKFKAELKKMNSKKQGARYVYSDYYIIHSQNTNQL
jgi:hypothetical protein